MGAGERRGRGWSAVRSWPCVSPGFVCIFWMDVIEAGRTRRPARHYFSCSSGEGVPGGMDGV